jgi:predicted nucleic acid-binding protein
VTYLDTGCLVKLYYPEPDTAKVVALIADKSIFHTPLHALEFVNALQLKIFFNSATPAQASAALALVDSDLKLGILFSPAIEWKDIFAEAVSFAKQHTGTIGCRSSDVLHCAAAKVLSATEFVTTDERQKKLAGAIGLNVVNF